MTKVSPMISDALSALSAGDTSATQLASAALQRAQRLSHLNIFAALDEAGAMRDAAASDERLRRRDARPLEGIPITVKDLLNLRGRRAQGGSRAPMPDLGVDEGRAVARLRAAGAVILGSTLLHEVGLGLTGENASTGDVKNPLDPARQAGGSSSGAGAAIGAGIGLAAIGTDTGGSIRVPASHCGAVSFKPSFGLVPLDGVIPLAPSCDHLGPITTSVDDARLIVEVMAGHRFALRDRDGAPAPRLAVPWRFLEGRLSIGVRRAFESLVHDLNASRASVRDGDPTDLALTTAAYTAICWAEAAHGHRAAVAAGALGAFTERVQACLNIGASTSAIDYLSARDSRRRIAACIASVFERGDVDALILPVTPTPAPLRGSTEVELESGHCAHRDAFIPLVAGFSLCGLPVVSLPMARVGGLPVGVQIVGPRGSDARVLEVARWIEASGLVERCIIPA